MSSDLLRRVLKGNYDLSQQVISQKLSVKPPTDTDIEQFRGGDHGKSPKPELSKIKKLVAPMVKERCGSVKENSTVPSNTVKELQTPQKFNATASELYPDKSKTSGSIKVGDVSFRDVKRLLSEQSNLHKLDPSVASSDANNIPNQQDDSRNEPTGHSSIDQCSEELRDTQATDILAGVTTNSGS